MVQRQPRGSAAPRSAPVTYSLCQHHQASTVSYPPAQGHWLKCHIPLDTKQASLATFPKPFAWLGMEKKQNLT